MLPRSGPTGGRCLENIRLRAGSQLLPTPLCHLAIWLRAQDGVHCAFPKSHTASIAVWTAWELSERLLAEGERIPPKI